MEGQRVEPKPAGGGKGKKIAIAAGIVLGVLACAYVGLCAWVGNSGAIFPHTVVGGVDVSGMTVEQAASALDQAVAQHGDQMAGTITYGDWRGTVTADQMDYDWSASAQAAWQDGRDSFFAQGGLYLARLMGQEHRVTAWSVSADAVDRLVDQMQEELGEDATAASYELDGDELVMTKGRTGVSVSLDNALDTVLDALDEAMERKLGQGEEGYVEAERELQPQETPPQEPDFDEIYREVHTQAKSAEMDPETFQVTDHVVGVDFDVEALRAAYEAAGEGETFSVPLELEEPKETKESLEGKLFADLLGEGSTVLTGTANRQFNVKLAAEACNGTILLPGDEFSFNGRTGSRSAAMGYKSATVYSGGKTVNEVGGGVCQTSSTIYYALLHTNLEVVERRNHGYNTGYVPEGMDATVYYGLTDFRFRNNTDYPVRIDIFPEWQGNKELLICRIYGTNPEGIYAVPESSTFNWQSPTTVYQPDETVPQGTTKVDTVQNPYVGVSAQTYRYVYDGEDNLLEKQDMGVSVYRMRPRTILYNPADGDPATWVDGVPGTGQTTDPNQPVDPGTATDPGAATDPGTATDPGAATDPGTAADPGTATDPVQPGDAGATTEPGTTTDPGTGTDPAQPADPGTNPDPVQPADAGGQVPAEPAA